MTTRVDINIDTSGLLDKALLQRLAGRETLVIREQQAKAEKQGIEKRAERRRTQGRDVATGELLPSRGGQGRLGSAVQRFDEEPAARRSGRIDLDISVIDEDSGYEESLAQQQWRQYRKKYPRNRFVRFTTMVGNSGLDWDLWKAEGDFTNDGNAYSIRVTRQFVGEPSTDWYEELKERRLLVGVRRIHLIIDNSGSLTTRAVEDDLQLFIFKAKQARYSFLPRFKEPGEPEWTEMDPEENWIQQHIEVNRR